MLIEDYAMIGDCQTAALVSRDGSIDWLCLPRFDSGACFAALLGTPANGRWLMAPAGQIRSTTRRYRGDTLILETDFVTDDGEVTVIDFMPPRTREPDLIRIVIGKRGRVRMQCDLCLRFDYGSIVPWVRQMDRGGIRATAGPDTVYCYTPVSLRDDDCTTTEFDVHEGQRVPFLLEWASTHDEVPAVRDVEEALRFTESYWNEWVGRCTYSGHWRDAVVRSLVTLKAMTYEPTGGIVAAVTTSLPEEIGGERNWDYRFCWLRDATFTLLALDVGGYSDEAAAWRQWLVNAIAGSPKDVQIMYGISGQRRLPEMILPWLCGYENSKPVRIGNAAYTQWQLDVFGEVADALYTARVMGLPANKDIWSLAKGLLGLLEQQWNLPDNGIWEVRGPPRHFTHSKVMAWVAADRAVKTIEQFGAPGDADRYRALRDTIHAQVCAEGFNPSVSAFTQYYGSMEPDASLLMLPLVGFLPATDPRIVGTVKLIQDRLDKEGFVYRYETETGVDGLPPGEGTFLLCSFWLADNLALMGRHAEARELYEKLLSLRNDVGLLAEGYDARLGRMTGNFPQAFSHIGMINTARNLSGHYGPAEIRQA
jgi:GH15 family glucan-1,4-alpha-glucosidase